jgi:hypothetical protein
MGLGDGYSSPYSLTTAMLHASTSRFAKFFILQKMGQISAIRASTMASKSLLVTLLRITLFARNIHAKPPSSNSGETGSVWEITLI